MRPVCVCVCVCVCESGGGRRQGEGLWSGGRGASHTPPCIVLDCRLQRSWTRFVCSSVLLYSTLLILTRTETNGESMTVVWLENSTKPGRLVWMLRYQLTKEYSGQCDHLHADNIARRRGRSTKWESEAMPVTPTLYATWDVGSQLHGCSYTGV